MFQSAVMAILGLLQLCKAVKQLLMTTRFSLFHPLCMLIGCLDIFSRRKQAKFFFRSEMYNKRKKISYFNICL